MSFISGDFVSFENVAADVVVVAAVVVAVVVVVVVVVVVPDHKLFTKTGMAEVVALN